MKNHGRFHEYQLESKDFKPHNPGIGQVAAASGQLTHPVSIAQDLVRDYRIVALTEWVSTYEA